MRGSVRRFGLTAALLVVGLAAGCSDDGAASDGSGPGSPAATSQGPETAVASPSDSESVSSEVAPATGPLLKLKSAQVRVPVGWKSTGWMLDVQLAAMSPAGETIAVYENEHLGSSSTTLDDLVAVRRDDYRRDNMKRLPDAELDGQPAFHLAGWTGSDRDRWREDLGTVRDGWYVVVSFMLDRDDSLKADPDIVQSVLATFEWRE